METFFGHYTQFILPVKNAKLWSDVQENGWTLLTEKNNFYYIYSSIHPQKGKPYSEWNMCYALFKKAIQILHIAGLLNSKNPIQIQLKIH